MVKGSQASAQRLGGGIHAVLFALFDAHGAVNYEAMTKQIDYVISNGCDGVTILGLATEVSKLSEEEQLELIAVSGLRVSGRAEFSVTVTGKTTSDYLAKVTAAERVRANWLILQPPQVSSMSPDQLEEFFFEVATATNLPVAIQNAPLYLPHWLPHQNLINLASRCQNFFAIKAEENAVGLETLIRALPDMLVLGGRGGLEMTDALRAGCRGFILAPDIAPAAVQIFKFWNEGRFDAAEGLYTSKLPAIVFTMQSLDHLIIYGKRIYGTIDQEAIFDRSPVVLASAFGLSAVERYARLLRLHH